MKENGIIYNTTNNPDTKASICERSIRTLKGRIFKYLTHNNTFTFIDKLKEFVNAYNNSYHRTIKMPPTSVNERNVLQVYRNIKDSQANTKRSGSKRKKIRIKAGDYVRITKSKNVFAKGYTKNFTSEVFRIKSVIHRDPVVFRIVDLDGEEIKGVFYEPEVQKIIFDEAADKLMEKIIKQRGKGKNLQYLIRWRNYGYKFDSWVNANSISK